MYAPHHRNTSIYGVDITLQKENLTVTQYWYAQSLGLF